MKTLLLMLLAAAVGAALLIFYQQRKALAAITGHKKTIGDAAEFVGAGASLWDDIKTELGK